MPERRVPSPTVAALVFMTWALAVGLGFGHRLLNADGDPARHVRHGLWILEHGVIRTDPFSFSRAGEPFIGFEYGSQVLFALAHRAAGLPGVVVFCGLLIAATWALVARFMLRRGVDPAFAYCVTMASAILGAMHWAARPHLFTQLFVIVLLDWLDRPAERRPAWWAFAGLFLAWVNLHGGFLYGLVLIGLFALADLGAWLRRPRDPPLRSAALGWLRILVAATAATIVNPYGPVLPVHVLGFFRNGLIQRYTNEFLAPGFQDLGTRLFLLTILTAFVAFARSSRPIGTAPLLVIVANVAFALMARRNIALFAITALPLLAIHFDAASRRLPEPPNFRASFSRAERTGHFWPWAATVAGALLLFAGLGGRIGAAQIIPESFDPAKFPVEAVARARAKGLEGRMYNHFLWGGYLLYAWPEQKIFIDGGTDHIGPAVLQDYLDISFLRPGWRERMKRYDFDHALVPTASPLAAELVREPGWRVAWCDQLAVLISRRLVDLGSPQPPTGATGPCDALAGGH